MSLYEQLTALQNKQGTVATNRMALAYPVVPTDAAYLEHVAETLAAAGFDINTPAMTKAPASRVGGPSILLALIRKGAKPANVTIWWNGKSSWAGVDPILTLPAPAPKAKKAKAKARKPKAKPADTTGAPASAPAAP